MAAHCVPVLSQEGHALTPTTPAKARKLVRAGAASPVWSRAGQYAVQLLTPSRSETPLTVVGLDTGMAHDGYAVVVGTENPLALKVDLPPFDRIVQAVRLRRRLRARRLSRLRSRRKQGYRSASSQAALASHAAARLRILKDLVRFYPVTRLVVEVSKNARAHQPHHELTEVRDYAQSEGIALIPVRDVFVSELRSRYGYTKSRNKKANSYTSHCSDALALAVDRGVRTRVEYGPYFTVEFSVHPVRRRMRALRAPHRSLTHSGGSVRGVRIGRWVGLDSGYVGTLLPNEAPDQILLRTLWGKREDVSGARIEWVSKQFPLYSRYAVSARHAFLRNSRPPRPRPQKASEAS